MSAKRDEPKLTPHWLLLLARGLLALNGIFWLGTMLWILSGGGIGLDGRTPFWWVAIVGLAFDGLLYFWIAARLHRKPFLFILTGFGLIGFNLLLVISDQVEFLDLAIIALTAAPGIPLLFLLWRLFRFPRAG